MIEAASILARIVTDLPPTPTPVYLRVCKEAGCPLPVFFSGITPPEFEGIAEEVDRVRVRHGWPPSEAERTFEAPEVAWRLEGNRNVLVTLAPVTAWLKTVHQHERGATP